MFVGYLDAASSVDRDGNIVVFCQKLNFKWN